MGISYVAGNDEQRFYGALNAPEKVNILQQLFKRKKYQN